MTDWVHIGPSLCIQNLCIYDNLNWPLEKNVRNNGLQFACCPYAGPVAIALPSNIPNSSTVCIFMQNGVQIASISASALFGLFWSRCQKLLLISANGRVLIYDPLGNLLNTFNMGDETMTLGIIDARIFNYSNETGLAVINNLGHIFVVNSINTPVLWRAIPTKGELHQNFTCWIVLANAPKVPQILLCSRTKFFHGQQGGALQICNFHWARQDGQYLQMVSDNNSKLLLLHDSKLVQLIDAEDDFILLRQIRLNCELTVDSKCLFWCDGLSFAIHSNSNDSRSTHLNIYSLDRRHAAADNPSTVDEEDVPNFVFTFPSPIAFFADMDGIRAFTHNETILLHSIPAQAKAVLSLGSDKPGALLFNAFLKLEQRSHVAYEFIRSISAEKMTGAVDDCLSAAAHNFDPKLQKQLLKAASMGIHRCDRPYDSNKFVRITRHLRVLNALRMMGIPLTFAQLDELKIVSIIDRLIALGHWPMAIQVCNFLEFEPKEGIYKVLAHWCLAMITAHKKMKSEAGGVNQLAQRIISQLSKYPEISYADIAEMATRQELHDLASTLLEKETNIGRQVAVMLKMKQREKALRKAAQSQQPDLMHLVLKHLRHNENARDVELLLRKVPQAWSIYQSEIQDEAPERLLTLYEQNDDYIRQTILYLKKAEQTRDIFDSSKSVENLGKAEKALRNMKDTASAQLVSESSQLIVENIKWEEKKGASLASLSVRETFIWAASNEEMVLMEQLKKQHRLNEKQVFYWTAEGFAQANKWQQLEQFVRARKNPSMGILPIVELCASHGNKNVAQRLLDGLNVYEEKIEAYLILGEVKKATTLAAERTDLQMLQMIRKRFPTTSPHWAEVSKVIEDISRTK